MMLTWMAAATVVALQAGPVPPSRDPTQLRSAQATPFPYRDSGAPAPGAAAPAEVTPFLHDEVAQTAFRWQRAMEGRRTVHSAFRRDGNLVGIMRLEPNGRHAALVEQFVVTYPAAQTIEVRRYVSPEEALASDPGGPRREAPTNDALIRMTRYTYEAGGTLIRGVLNSDSRGRQVDYIAITRDGSGQVREFKGRIGFKGVPNDPGERAQAYRRAFDLWDQFGRLP